MSRIPIATLDPVTGALTTPQMPLANVPKVPTVTANGTLTANTLVPADASAGAITQTLPTGAAPGAVILLEKIDASTNQVIATGTIRGTPSSSIALKLQSESVLFVSEGSNSWRPLAGHKTLSSLDTRYDPAGAATTARGQAMAFALAM